MKISPARTDLISSTVRADERVAPVSPVSRPAGVEGPVQAEGRRPAFTSFRNEDLVERYRRAGVASTPEVTASRSAGRAVNAYTSVHLVNEREAVVELLGVSLYA